ncbi:MAG: chemotaxis protein CheA [Steroidobacteraceae bacterium]
MSVELAQFLDTFFQECGEALDLMEGTLLKLDVGAPDPEMVNTLFRGAHSIKGGAGMFGFTQMAEFTHGLETLLDGLRAGKVAVSPDLVELLLTSVDALREMIVGVQRNQPTDAARFETLASAIAASASGIETLTAHCVPSAPAERETRAVSNTAPRWRVDLKPGPGLLERGNDPLQLISELGGLGELDVRADCGHVAQLAELVPEHCQITWQIDVQTKSPRDSIELIFDWARGDCQLEISPAPLDAEPTKAQHHAGQAKPEAAGEDVEKPSPGARVPLDKEATRNRAPDSRVSHSDASSIRVSIEKIDELMNSVGEIVITQSMLSQQLLAAPGLDATRMRGALTQLERNVRAIQESVMRVRMLPISVVFSRFPRLVRDLSQRLGKQIHLKVTGEQTELDKIVLERIGDPLVHLVRNSIDHGIETPEARIVAGKSEHGTVQLNAFHKGGAIRIEVSDDGRGLSRERILEKARARGLIGESEPLTDEQIYDLIFVPGFSTAEQTTDLSGRGVGMDVVRRNIHELGGTIEIDSKEGSGTRISVTLPLTLAIIDGQLVRVNRDTYIVPLIAIVESLQLRRGAVSRLAGRGEVFEFRGNYVPLIRLNQLFGFDVHTPELAEGLVMVVEGDGRRVGLFVDELLGEQQVVIKSLDANYGRIEGISGATVLGEGTVALIIDVPGLIRLASEAQSRSAA